MMIFKDEFKAMLYVGYQNVFAFWFVQCFQAQPIESYANDQMTLTTIFHLSFERQLKIEAEIFHMLSHFPMPAGDKTDSPEARNLELSPGPLHP